MSNGVYRVMMFTQRLSSRVPIFQLAVGLAVLAGVGQMFGRLSEVAAAENTTGAKVILMRECTDEESDNRGDSRDIYVRLRNDGSVFINEGRVAEGDLIGKINEIFARRQEKVLSLVGEDGISYQRVAVTAAELQGRVDALHIFLPTKSNLHRKPFFCLVPNETSASNFKD